MSQAEPSNTCSRGIVVVNHDRRVGKSVSLSHEDVRNFFRQKSVAQDQWERVRVLRLFSTPSLEDFQNTQVSSETVSSGSLGCASSSKLPMV